MRPMASGTLSQAGANAEGPKSNVVEVPLPRGVKDDKPFPEPWSEWWKHTRLVGDWWHYSSRIPRCRGKAGKRGHWVAKKVSDPFFFWSIRLIQGVPEWRGLRRAGFSRRLPRSSRILRELPAPSARPWAVSRNRQPQRPLLAVRSLS